MPKRLGTTNRTRQLKNPHKFVNMGDPDVPARLTETLERLSDEIGVGRIVEEMPLPDSFRATATGAGILLEWRDVSPDLYRSVYGAQIWRADASLDASEVFSANSDKRVIVEMMMGTAYLDTHTEAEKTYLYWVRWRDLDGRFSSPAGARSAVAPSVGNGGGGEGPDPGDSVVTETSFGQAPAPGSSLEYSRADHTHGTPDAPEIPDVPSAGDTVVEEITFGQASSPGSSVAYSREDHTHGTPPQPGAGEGANGLISGGMVAWLGGLEFLVSPATYRLSGVVYNSAQTQVTLSAADPDFPRVDVIIVDNTGTVSVLEGTPAAEPLAPTVDPETQIALTFVLVPAGGSEPEVVKADIYLENTEWTTSTNAPARINFNSTSSPFAGSKSIEVTSGANADRMDFTKPAAGTENLANYNNLVLYIKSKATWPNAKSLSVVWLNGSTAVGQVVSIKTGLYGFDSSITANYQQIVIPAKDFNVPGLVTALRITISGGGAAIGFFADSISLQGGVSVIVIPVNLLKWLGAWASTVQYQRYDVVTYNSVTYIALSPNLNVTPSSSPATWQIIGVHSAPSAASSVVSETSFGLSPVVGTGTNYAREDHTHGTPAAPAGATPGDTVVSEVVFGQAPTAGTATEYSRADHTHGTPDEPEPPNPGDTVVSETSFGQSPDPGDSDAYSRANHTHGTPAAPSVPAPATTVVSEVFFGQSPVVGTATTYAREDHSHGTPDEPVGGGGEANTASNVGSGEGVFKDKLGVDLRFKSLLAGRNIFLTSSTNEIEVKVITGIVSITYNGATASNWASGNEFQGSVTGNFTLSNPTNAVNGQKVVYVMRATGDYTISFGTKFRFSQTLPQSSIQVSSVSGRADRLAVEYDSVDDKFDVVAFLKGYS